MLCVGTVMGDRSSILSYTQIMGEELDRIRSHHPCMDSIDHMARRACPTCDSSELRSGRKGGDIEQSMLNFLHYQGTYHQFLDDGKINVFRHIF